MRRLSVSHTSGSQEIPGGLTVDFVTMAKGAGYRDAYAVRDLDEPRRRLPSILGEEGPLLVELWTTLAEQTPMTVPRGTPFHAQVEGLRRALLKPRL